MLLPRERLLDDEEDPRQVLVDRLLEYQKIKAACAILRQKEADELPKWKRDVPPPHFMGEELDLTEISLFNLAEAFFILMKKKERENIQIIMGKEYSMEEKMNEIIEFLKENHYLDFTEYFESHTTIEEALVSFFCLLELDLGEIHIPSGGHPDHPDRRRVSLHNKIRARSMDQASPPGQQEEQTLLSSP
jgi:segregation and condensation protein A